MRGLFKGVAGLVVLTLAGCGGGGGGSGGGSGVLSVTPSSIDDEVITGISESLSLQAQSNLTTGERIYTQMSDPSGLLQGILALSGSSGYYTGTVLVPALAAGHYKGAFEIELCKDSACTEHFSGSPMKLPYDIQVDAVTQNFKALSRLDVAEWSTLHGGNEHAGYVPVTLDAASFSQRWVWTPAAGAISQVPVTGDGLGYVTLSGSSPDSLVAFDELTGAAVWSVAAADLNTPNPPAIDDGVVYVSNGAGSSAAMWAFDAQGGQVVFEAPLQFPGSFALAPVVADGKIYSARGSSGGLYCIDATTGVEQWSVSTNIAQTWSPTIANGEILIPVPPAPGSSGYGYYASGLARVSFAGSTLGFTVSSEQDALYSASSIVAAQSGELVAANGETLTAYSAGGEVLWQQSGLYRAMPAVAGDEVFAISGWTLEVRNLADGALLWSWTPPDDPGSGSDGLAPLVTDNLVFFGAASNTYAVDRVRHANVWSYPMSGDMSLSPQGLLYIRLNSSLAAINIE